VRQNTAYVAETRYWPDVAHFVDLIRISDDDRWLEEQAYGILALAPDIDGPMPDSVAAFVARFVH
jgi:hypothetical protein